MKILSLYHLNACDHWMIEICQECEMNTDIIAHWGTKITSINHHRVCVGNSGIWVFFDPRNGANEKNNGGEPGLSSFKLKDVQENYSIDLKRTIVD